MSGKQWWQKAQLLSLARVLLRRQEVKVVVMDEATSAIDMATDERIQRVLREQLKSQTFVAIAHRLNTVIDHKLLVMDAGEVVEFGMAAELLLNSDGYFTGMVRAMGTSASAALQAKIGMCKEVQTKSCSGVDAEPSKG